MRKLVKIVLTIVVIIVSVFIGTAINIAIAPTVSGLPALVMLILMVGGIVGIWKYKPSTLPEKKNSEMEKEVETKLDKS